MMYAISRHEMFQAQSQEMRTELTIPSPEETEIKNLFG